MDGRQLLSLSMWGGWGDVLGMLCSLLAGRQAHMLEDKDYSMAALSSSPLPNNGALSLLRFPTFSQVPSVMAFHSPAYSVSLSPPTEHHFPVPQAVSTLPTPAFSQGLTSEP